MKKLAHSFCALLALCDVARGADLPPRKSAASPPPQILLWNGFYVGANLGGGWARHGSGGVAGGLQAGYNYQLTPLFVVGLETDFQGTSIVAARPRPSLDPLTALFLAGGGNAVAPFPPAFGPPASRNIAWFGTVRGRVGVVALSPSLLLYGTGGFAYGGGGSGVAAGWTAGAGAEWAFAPRWSAKLEYLYTDLSGGGANGAGGRRGGAQFQIVRAGLNYRFDPGAFAPALTKF